MAGDNLSLYVGGEIKVVALNVAGRMFVFTPNQQAFLMSLQKLKSVHAAALSIGKDEEWGRKFLASRKFREYLSLKMKSFSDRNGLDVDWWYGFGKNLTDGYREFYAVRCEVTAAVEGEIAAVSGLGGCGYVGEMDLYAAESNRSEEMDLVIPCPACLAPMKYELVREEFKPSREQVEGWKTLGDRIIPKVERVHHQFENSEILFETNDTQETR